MSGSWTSENSKKIHLKVPQTFTKTSAFRLQTPVPFQATFENQLPNINHKKIPPKNHFHFSSKIEA